MDYIVKVEEEARTSEERVDIEAERTRITTSPIKRGERSLSIVGIMLSKPFLRVPSSSTSILFEKFFQN